MKKFEETCSRLGMVWIDGTVEDIAFAMDTDYIQMEASCIDEKIILYVETESHNFDNGKQFEFKIETLKEFTTYVELLKEHGEWLGTNAWRPHSKKLRELRKSLNK